MGVIFGLLALFGWAVGDIFAAQASRQVGNVKTLFWKLVLSFLLTSAYLPYALPVADYRLLVVSAGLGLILFTGELAYLTALAVGNVSLAGAVSSAYPFLVVLLSLAIYQEKLNSQQIWGIVLTILGITLVSLNWHAAKNIFSDKGIKYALIALVAFSLYLTFVKIPASRIGWFWQPYTYSFAWLILLVASWYQRKKLAFRVGRGSFIPIIMATLLTLVANFAYNFGVVKGFVSIIGPITGAQAVLFVILAQIFFRERMSRQQLIGLLVTLSGILLLSL